MIIKQFVKIDGWKIIENGFNPQLNEEFESLCSLGNGHMGHRANFEEKYSGRTMQGNYVAGIYYPDKTRVGWWKNGYPEYFAKVLNATNWIGINIKVNGQELDLAQCKVSEYIREVDMKEGFLKRTFIAEFENGNRIKVDAKRFLSIVEKEIGAIEYFVKALNFSGEIEFSPYLDGDVRNQDSNYDEKFWVEVEKKSEDSRAFIISETKKTEFQVCTLMDYTLSLNKSKVSDISITTSKSENKIYHSFSYKVNKGDVLTLHKYVTIVTSRDHKKSDLEKISNTNINIAKTKGFAKLKDENATAWIDKWKHADIKIEGDESAQQAIRFNIFQLHQTYTGHDARLNIGPKGFTGEKYGGSTYWDTEAYCLPFYLSTASPEVSKNLLIYRYNHLGKAIENAAKLGFTNGAALYPMVTMNGEECHNEWEITFEEIHRNGAIAYAIPMYINYTGDTNYLAEYGLEVLIAISRFWAQRVHFSKRANKYMIHGVTGPNEYENNVNNNFYTNKLASWTLKYTTEALETVKNISIDDYNRIVKKSSFNFSKEVNNWKNIINNMYYPYDKELDIFLQQDNFLDKELIETSELNPTERPINQHWSWDRILRSNFIKQADTLQAVYLFEDEFDNESIKRHFDFYEPRTVHESSLSPCIHSILAAKLGNIDKAYEMYLRTSRLDLDDYNKEVAEGCHTTSMSGTWMSIVYGFAGMRIKNGELLFNPLITDKWKSYSFHINFKDRILLIKIDKNQTQIQNIKGEKIDITINNTKYTVTENKILAVNNK